MTDKLVDLIRRFAPISSRSREWDFLMPESGSVDASRKLTIKPA